MSFAVSSTRPLGAVCDVILLELKEHWFKYVPTENISVNSFAGATARQRRHSSDYSHIKVAKLFLRYVERSIQIYARVIQSLLLANIYYGR
jgi:hypothetical protein